MSTIEEFLEMELGRLGCPMVFNIEYYDGRRIEPDEIYVTAKGVPGTMTFQQCGRGWSVMVRRNSSSLFEWMDEIDNGITTMAMTIIDYFRKMESLRELQMCTIYRKGRL